MHLKRHLLGFTPRGAQSSRINAPPYISHSIYIYIYIHRTVPITTCNWVTGNFIRKLRASWIDQSAIPWVMSLFLYVGYVSVTTGNHHYISSKILIRSDSKGIWTCDFVFRDFQAPFLMYNKNIMFFFPMDVWKPWAFLSSCGPTSQRSGSGGLKTSRSRCALLCYRRCCRFLHLKVHVRNQWQSDAWNSRNCPSSKLILRG